MFAATILSLAFVPDFSFLMKYFYNSCNKIIFSELFRPLTYKSRCFAIVLSDDVRCMYNGRVIIVTYGPI